MNKKIIVRIKKEPEFRDLPTPDYATPMSSGVDLYAAVDTQMTLPPKTWRLISTGIRIAIPEGFEAQIRPRSGLALKYGVTLLNTPGTIDSDYRGIVGVIMINHGDEPFVLKRGDRLAQLVISPVARLEFTEVTFMRATERGEGGFGSTGFGFDIDKTEEVDPTDRVKKE
jgi:dUTP pyrophosphatase